MIDKACLVLLHLIYIRYTLRYDRLAYWARIGKKLKEVMKSRCSLSVTDSYGSSQGSFEPHLYICIAWQVSYTTKSFTIRLLRFFFVCDGSLAFHYTVIVVWIYNKHFFCWWIERCVNSIQDAIRWYCILMGLKFEWLV